MNDVLLPASQMVLRGTEAEFVCLTPFPVTWKYNKYRILKSYQENVTMINVGEGKKKLIISDVQENNLGWYSCEFPNGNYVVHMGESNLGVVGKYCYIVNIMCSSIDILWQWCVQF